MFKEKNFPCSSGIQTRDFLYVTDALNFIYKIMIGQDVGMIINLGSEKNEGKAVIKYIAKICKVGYQILDSLNLEKMKL